MGGSSSQSPARLEEEFVFEDCVVFVHFVVQVLGVGAESGRVLEELREMRV